MSVIVPVSLPDELFDRIEAARRKSNNGHTGMVFKRSPFYQKVLTAGLKEFENGNK